MMKLVGWFDHLLDEISALDDNLVLSTIGGNGYKEKAEDETLIGELPMNLKQFSVFMEVKRKELDGKSHRAIEKFVGEMKNLTPGDITTEQMAIGAAIDADNEDLEMYSRLFWWGIRLEFPQSAGKNLGIRRGGTLVERLGGGDLPMLAVQIVRMPMPDSVPGDEGFFPKFVGGLFKG